MLLGLLLWIGFPTSAAYQDITSLVAGSEGGGAERWSAFVETAVAGSVHAAEMPFDNAGLARAGLSGSGLTRPGIGKVALRGRSSVANRVPDEDRVQRAGKQGRLVKMAPVTPPKSFNAGSVFERTSSLIAEPGAGDGPEMAFAAPAIKGQERAIAGTFHATLDPGEQPGVPAALASLITSEKADVLATAYGPSTPDYARASPFESLLQDDPNQGRFVPPLADGDHDWMARPLPAEVFGAAEQKCLANAVYFESRGETAKGQAAVAQVVLNRVRSPAYPKTICGVVYQNDGWRRRCQFSFACDGIKDRVVNPANYQLAQEIAMAVTAGKIFIPEIGSSTHYYASYVHPGWARTMQRMKQIGLHIFYRTYGGGWS